MSSLPGLRKAGLLVAALAALSWGAVPALAESSSASAEGPLHVVGGRKARTAFLAACSPPERVAGQAPGFVVGGACAGANRNSPRYIGGQVTLLVRNASAKKARLAISYVADGSSTAIALPGSSRRVFLAAEGRRSNPHFNRLLKRAGASAPRAMLRRAFRVAVRSAASRALWIGKGKVRSISIGFVLRPGEAASSIDGNLILRLAGGNVIVPVKGALRTFEDVSVDPETLKLDSGEDAATISLVGPEVVQFLRFGSIGRKHLATLRSDSGDSVKAQVEFPKPSKVAAQENPNRAEATVSFDAADPPPGTYTGKLALSDYSPDAPAVDVELQAGRSLLVLIGLALLGVVAVGLLSRMTAFALRRSLLLKVLAQSRAAYDHIAAMGVDTASWGLGDLLGKKQASRRADEYRLQGAQGLQVSIETARSIKDLDEDTDRVLKMVARIQRWLRVEPAARLLKQVHEDGPDGEVNKKTWRQSWAWRETQMLREVARREPVDVAAADDLVTRLLQQAEWLHGFAAVWDAASKDEDSSLGKGVEKLELALAAAPPVGKRTPQEQDALDEQLRELIAGLELDPVPPLEDEPSEKYGITDVDWTASPNSFTGWATLDGESYGQLASRAARGARRLGFREIKIELGSIGPTDFFWSGISLGLACAVYGLKEYNDTWGSGQDLATAFIAGATGAVVVKWAALPIFQSIRARASEAKAPPAKDKKEAAKKDKKEEKAVEAESKKVAGATA